MLIMYVQGVCDVNSRRNTFFDSTKKRRPKAPFELVLD
jgi:hypothetical protein